LGKYLLDPGWRHYPPESRVESGTVTDYPPIYVREGQSGCGKFGPRDSHATGNTSDNEEGFGQEKSFGQKIGLGESEGRHFGRIGNP